MAHPYSASKKPTKGFSLIELLIVITIIGILAAIVFPNYSTYVQKGHRTDAISSLINLEAAQENYRFSNASYATTFVQLQSYSSGITSTSPLSYYSLSISAVTSTGYTLTATATGAQASDTTCATITITLAAGVETKAPSTCWQGY